MVALADVRQRWVGGLPQLLGEGEGVETVGRRVAQPGFQRPAVFARPDLMQVGLDDGVEVPAVSSKNFESLREDIMGWGCREVKVFSGTCNSKTVAKGTDCFI